MQTTEDYFVIRVPRFAGYKTLFVNAVIIAAGLVAAVWPQFNTPVDAGTVGTFYDALTGGIVALIGLVNVALRLMTTTPAAPFKKEGGDAGSDPAQRLNFTVAELETALGAKVPVYMAWDVAGKPDETMARDVAGRPAPTVAQAIAYDRANTPDGPVRCAWPECACHQRCEPCETYPVVQLTTEEKRRERGLSRQIMAAFFVPLVAFPLLFSGVMLLAGCETVQAVNAVAAAESTEQRGFALYGTYVVLQERAAELVRDRNIPKAVRKRIQDADRIAYPLAERVRVLAIELNTARMAFNTAQGPADKVAAASAALGQAIVILAPAIQAVTAAVNEARA